MSKKRNRGSKVLISGLVLSSAFVANAPVNAESKSEVEKLVRSAESYAGSLKWAISVEGTNKDITSIPWDLYNQTKAAYQKAKDAVSKLKSDERNIYEARLQQNVELYISTTPNKVGRAVAYIDAVNAGKKIEEKKQKLEERLQKNIIDDETEKLYHDLSKELKKQSKLLDRVYGKTTREAIRNHFKKSAENVKADAMYPITIKMKLDLLEEAISNNKKEEMTKLLTLLDELVKEAEKLGNVTKHEPIYEKFNKEIKEYKEVVEAGKDEPTPAPQTPVPDNSTEQPGNDVPSEEPPSEQLPSTYDSPGSYGPSEGVATINDNVTVTSDDVTLKNMVIKGDLIISESVAEGEVCLQNVKVEGTTYVRGGGINSIHFEDSVLATVIVNKNNGAIRIVASGSTRVVEVQLESYVKIEESDLDENAEGFTDINISETVQSTDSNLQVELLGSFETINSRAAQVRLNLSEATSIESLVLNAVASVLGQGRIVTAEVNSDGSTLSTMPQNVVLNNGTTVTVNDQVIDESVSSETQTQIQTIEATQASIKVNFEKYVAGISTEEFDVTATLDGEEIELQNVQYYPAFNRITYTPLSLTEGNVGKTLSITVKPSSNSEKLHGEAISDEVFIGTGFEGRITDVAEVGFEGVTIKFRDANDANGEIVGEAVTDKFGFYSVSLPAGEYIGEMSGPNVISSNMYAAAPSDVYNTHQNETAIRAAASSELKIMLSWGEEPRDLDSHLIGQTIDGTELHTAYYDQVHEEDGVTYVDLDWDDTNSYGPETTTFRKLKDGKYVFYVHNFSEEPNLAESNANVKIFKGNAQTADQTFTLPTGTGSELYWVVFAVEIKDNGESVSVMPINELEQSEVIPNDYLKPQESLQELIATGKEFFEEEDNNSTEERDALTEAIANSEAVLANPDVTMKELFASIRGLRLALALFMEVPEEPGYEYVPVRNEVISLNAFHEFYILNDFINGLGMDPEGLELTVQEESSEIVNFSIGESTVPEEGIALQLRPVQVGEDTLHIHAENAAGQEATLTLHLRVTDVDMIDFMHFIDVGEEVSLNLNNFFVEYRGMDPETISYTFDQESEGIVEATIVEESSQPTLKLLGLTEGEDVINLYAEDGEGNSHSVQFRVQVGTITETNQLSITSVGFEDLDDNVNFSTSDIISFTFNQDISQLNLPTNVNVEVLDLGEQDQVVVYSTETPEVPIATLTVSNVVEGNVVFDGNLVVDGVNVSVELGELVSGEESSFTDTDGSDFMINQFNTGLAN
ncbi:hypothetical protein ACFFHF_09875 [Robertmurraya beringensis]|uniref:SbsC C-terminal domain-containing protein n=1 Tax=Robertmurraya beringensis TaxID=641660 RepID=A0ABV6KQF1_9BACI